MSAVLQLIYESLMLFFLISLNRPYLGRSRNWFCRAKCVWLDPLRIRGLRASSLRKVMFLACSSKWGRGWWKPSFGSPFNYFKSWFVVASCSRELQCSDLWGGKCEKFSGKMEALWLVKIRPMREQRLPPVGLETIPRPRLTIFAAWGKRGIQSDGFGIFQFLMFSSFVYCLLNWCSFSYFPSFLQNPVSCTGEGRCAAEKGGGADSPAPSPLPSPAPIHPHPGLQTPSSLQERGATSS